MITLSPFTTVLWILGMFAGAVLLRSFDRPGCPRCGGRLRHSPKCPFKNDEGQVL